MVTIKGRALPEDVLSAITSRVASKACKHLIENKHLYQNYQLSNAEETVEDEGLALDKADMKRFSNHLKWRWEILEGEKQIERYGTAGVVYVWIKTAHIYCDDCGRTQPFNPDVQFSVNLDSGGGFIEDQTLLFAFLCQGCKRQRAQFLICKSETKIQLCGRHPIELIGLPISSHIES